MDIKAKLEEARKCINQSLIGLEEKERDDVFEIRIPNLRPNEIVFVRSEVKIFTKELLNQIDTHRQKAEELSKS